MQKHTCIIWDKLLSLSLRDFQLLFSISIINMLLFCLYTPNGSYFLQYPVKIENKNHSGFEIKEPNAVSFLY